MSATHVTTSLNEQLAAATREMKLPPEARGVIGRIIAQIAAA